MQKIQKLILAVGFKKAFMKLVQFYLNLKGQAGFDKADIG